MNKIKFTMILSTFYFYSGSAYAYLDPGSGSIIVQSILGLIAASLFVLKTYWYKIKRLTLKFFKKINNIEN